MPKMVAKRDNKLCRLEVETSSLLISTGQVIAVVKASVVLSTEIGSIQYAFHFRHIAVLDVVTWKKSDCEMFEVM